MILDPEIIDLLNKNKREILKFFAKKQYNKATIDELHQLVEQTENFEDRVTREQLFEAYRSKFNRPVTKHSIYACLRKNFKTYQGQSRFDGKPERFFRYIRLK